VKNLETGNALEKRVASPNSIFSGQKDIEKGDSSRLVGKKVDNKEKLHGSEREPCA